MRFALRGGSAATGGLHYQALVTLCELLDLVEDSELEPDATFHIESHPPTPERPSESDPIVDFSVTLVNGTLAKVAQVKSTIDPERNRTVAPAAVEDLLRLTAVGDAEVYQLLTNAPLNGPAREVADAVADASLSNDALRDRLADLAASRPSVVATLRGLPASGCIACAAAASRSTLAPSRNCGITSVNGSVPTVPACAAA